MLTVLLCVCVLDAPPGSRPALQVHHPRVTGPHQGGVPVSSGSVPQVDNTNTHIHMEGSSVFMGGKIANFLVVIYPPTLNLNLTTVIPLTIMNKTPTLASY